LGWIAVLANKCKLGVFPIDRYRDGIVMPLRRFLSPFMPSEEKATNSVWKPFPATTAMESSGSQMY